MSSLKIKKRNFSFSNNNQELKKNIVENNSNFFLKKNIFKGFSHNQTIVVNNINSFYKEKEKKSIFFKKSNCTEKNDKKEENIETPKFAILNNRENVEDNQSRKSAGKIKIKNVLNLFKNIHFSKEFNLFRKNNIKNKEEKLDCEEKSYSKFLPNLKLNFGCRDKKIKLVKILNEKFEKDKSQSINKKKLLDFKKERTYLSYSSAKKYNGTKETKKDKILEEKINLKNFNFSENKKNKKIENSFLNENNIVSKKLFNTFNNKKNNSNKVIINYFNKINIFEKKKENNTENFNSFFISKKMNRTKEKDINKYQKKKENLPNLNSTQKEAKVFENFSFSQKKNDISNKHKRNFSLGTKFQNEFNTIVKCPKGNSKARKRGVILPFFLQKHFK